jgi:copper chaperone CopZ
MENKDNANIYSAVTLDIGGMHCESCVGRVETALLRLAGVAGVEVNLANQNAKISFDSEKVSVDDLKTSVEAEGYHVADESEKGSELKAECCNESSFSWLSNRRSYLYGALASIAIVGVYLGMNTLTADWYFARVQFSEYRWWILTLAIGFHGRLRGHVCHGNDGLLRPLPCHCHTGAGSVVSISSGSGKHS